MLNVKAMPKKNKRTRRRNAGGQGVPKVVVTAVGPTVNKRKPRSKRKQAMRNDSLIKPVLSKCAYEYAMAISDPWSNEAVMACVPTAGGLTQRATGFIRGTGTIGTGTSGYVIVSPTTANNCVCLWYTGATFANGATQIDIVQNTTGAITTGVTGAVCGNLPYNDLGLIGGGVSVRSNLSARIVSAGLRVWYTGRQTNMAGMMFGLRTPMHNSVQILSGVSGTFPNAVNGMGNYRETQICNFDRRGVTISDFAAYSEEGDMSTYTKKFSSAPSAAVAQTWTLYPFTGGESAFISPNGGSFVIPTGTAAGVNAGIPTLGVLMTGTAGESFQFEYVVHVEYGGPATATTGIRAPVDPVGFQKVLDAAADAQTNNSTTDRKPMKDKLFDALRYIESMAEPVLLDKLRSYGASYLQGLAKQQPSMFATYPAAANRAADVDASSEEKDDESARRGSMVFIDESR